MIVTKEDFNAFVSSVKCPEVLAFGIASLQNGASAKVVAASFAKVNYKENKGFLAVMLSILGIKNAKGSEGIFELSKANLEEALKHFTPFLGEKGHDNIKAIQAALEFYAPKKYAFVVLFEDAKPLSLEAIYLKLYLLSLKKCEPRELNLEGAFGILPNLAWSGNTPYELDFLRENEARLKFSNEYPKIDFVDKFPRFLAHIIPEDNTRILDDSRVRMGAYLAAGTTIMPGASYVNFNAGTTGACMVEGRISSSAIVGAGSDIGGGASILGVLSGTSGTPISIGKACLLGANSVTGISLGDACVVDAGIAVLEGSKVCIMDKDELSKLNPGFDFSKGEVKAILLCGLNGLHFRLDSTKGKLVVFASKKAVRLNEDLH